MNYIKTFDDFVSENYLFKKAGDMAPDVAMSGVKNILRIPQEPTLKNRIYGNVGRKVILDQAGGALGKSIFNILKKRFNKNTFNKPDENTSTKPNESINEDLKWNNGIYQYMVPSISKEVKERLSEILGISTENMVNIGGAGKKRDKNDLSHNIDIAVDKNRILESINLNLRGKYLLNFIVEKLQNNNINSTIHQNKIIIEWPLNENGTDGDTIEVKLHISKNIEWTEFSKYSPNLNENESDYTGKYRELLLKNIVGNSYKKIISYIGDNDVIKEYQTYNLNFDDGLELVTYSFLGKNGILKNAQIIEDGKRLVTNNPDTFTEIIFGENFKSKDIMTLEGILEVLNSSDFKNRKKVPLIMSNFKSDLIANNLNLI